MATKKPLSIAAWLKQLPPPNDGNRASEAAFFEEHWRYGGRVHEETVKALVAALSEPSEIAVGHALFLRLFTEFANALETVGAWGWAIRNRRDFPLLLDGFLAYPHSGPREFTNVFLLTRIDDFAWPRFMQVGKWALLAYLVIAGMIEYAFVYDHTRGAQLVVMTAMLALFMLNVPVLIAFTVARYQATA